MDELLRRFNGDVHTKEALLDFIVSHIDEVALERMYKGEDVSHVKDARMLIEGAFDELTNLYAVPNKQAEEAGSSR